MPSLLLRAIVLACLLPVFLLSTPASLSRAGDTTFSLKDAEKQVKKLAKGADPADLQAYMENMDAMEKLRSDLGAYCEANPDDVEACHLMMKLYEVNQLYGIEMKPGESPSQQRERYTGPYVKVIDTALQRMPDDAELHYWRARLHSFSEPICDQTGLDTANTQLPQAIDQIRTAIELEPANEHYRETLGIFLALSGDEAGGMRELQAVDDTHPVYVLLRDWHLLGAPEELLPDPAMTNLLVSMMTGWDHAVWRFRGYVFLGSAEELKGCARRSWPGFDIVPEPGPEGATIGRQVLLWKKDVITPAAKNAKDLDKYGNEEGFDGFYVSVTELVADSVAVQRRPHVHEGDTYCSVMLLNSRKVKAR
jgi:hypothetical protein